MWAQGNGEEGRNGTVPIPLPPPIGLLGSFELPSDRGLEQKHWESLTLNAQDMWQPQPGTLTSGPPSILSPDTYCTISEGQGFYEGSGVTGSPWEPPEIAGKECMWGEKVRTWRWLLRAWEILPLVTVQPHLHPQLPTPRSGFVFPGLAEYLTHHTSVSHRSRKSHIHSVR